MITENTNSKREEVDSTQKNEEENEAPHRRRMGQQHHPKLPHGSAMSRLTSHDLHEAISNLLTVAMHLQDTLSNFHRPGLHKVDIRVHVASAWTRTLALHESQSC